MNFEHILDTAFAFRRSKALLSAVELGLFDVLADGPQSVEEFSCRLRLQGRGVCDFLDALVAWTLLDRGTEERCPTPGLKPPDPPWRGR